MHFTVIGILPPLPGHFDHISSNLNSISKKNLDDDENCQSIRWKKDYSLVEDEENQNKLTLLMSAIHTDPITAEDVVEAVQKELLNSSASSCGSAAGGGGDGDGDKSSVAISSELWASSPVPLSMRPLEGYDSIIDIDPELWEEDAPRVMREYGIVAQKNILGATEIARLKEIVESAIADVESKLAKHRPEIEVGEDTFLFREIASRNTERFDLRLDTVPGAQELVEKYVIQHPHVRLLLDRVLGPLEQIDFDISVIYSRPGAVDQKWHSDGAHQANAKDAGFEEDGWKTSLADAYALCLFIPLIDLDRERGYTQFWPGSHRHRNLDGFGTVAELAKATYDGICDAGSGIWYDYRLLHRGRFNVSNLVRPVLQIIPKKKWYVERVNYGKESIVRDG